MDQKNANGSMRNPQDEREHFDNSPLARNLSMAQGGYYLATGVWSLVDIKSFQAVTGPKVDLWLVKTVGVLVGVLGGALIAAGARRRITKEISLLAVGSAAGLAAIDTYYVAKKRISPVYLLDAAAELGLIGGWALASNRNASSEDERAGDRAVTDEL